MGGPRGKPGETPIHPGGVVKFPRVDNKARFFFCLQYCKYYLVKFCPHDLFVNTRADLGACAKVHDEEVKKLFDQAKGHKKIFYQEEFIRYVFLFVNATLSLLLKKSL